MLDNSNNGSANFGNAQGAAVWQSEWIEALWGQLTTGSYNGIGNVVVDSDISQTEEQILADLDTVNRMLLGSNEASGLISDIKSFATRHTFNPGVDPVTGSSITATTQSLAQVFQSVHEQGLPDLTASVGELTLNEVALPGDGGRLSITLANQGSLQTKHPVTLKVFAAQQATLDSSAVEIGEMSFGSLKLEPNKTKTVSAVVNLPDDFSPGEYNIFVALDTDNNVPEASEANNAVLASFTQTVAWQFGNVGGENRQLALTDSDGDIVRFKLKGDGYGEVSEANGVKQIVLHNTTDETEASIQADGNGHVLSGVTVNGDLKQFYGTKTDLRGRLTVTGSLDRLVLDDVSDAQILVGPGSDADHSVEIKLDQVSDLAITSQSVIKKIEAKNWTSTEGIPSSIEAPEVTDLRVKGDFSGDLNITGALKEAKIDGSASGVWSLGSTDKLDLNSTTADWSLAVAGELDKLDVKQDLLGGVAAGTLNRLFVRGDLANATVLVGADLDADRQVGGEDDDYGSGELKEFIVYGDILSSVVGAGLNPVDSSFTNGNERLVAGGVIGKIDVRGQVSTDSLFAAETFNKTVKFDKQKIDPEIDSRFLTPGKVATDGEAPVVTLALKEDTGSNSTDGLTSVATLTGTVSDASGIASLKAGFGDTPVEEFVDISQYLQGESFLLDKTALASILGQPFTDGSYIFSVIAEDTFGNVTERVSYEYTLDSTSPTLSLFSPLTDGQHSSYVHLAGSVDEAVTVAVTLDDSETTSFSIEAGEFDRLLQALPLAVGARQLALTLTDAAGNTVQSTVDFEVSETAFATGASDTKGWAATTTDSVILGESDSYVVQAKLPVELGQSEGTRTLRFAINAAFDTSDENSSSEDRFALYLVDPANLEKTILDNGIAGTPLFSLAGKDAEFTPGLVRYDGQYVEIDLTSVEDITEGLLVFQLLNQDDDTGSRISIDSLTNELDVEGTEGPRFPIDTTLARIGEPLEVEALSASTTVQALFSNVRFDVDTGEYTAELRLKNIGEDSISRRAAVVFADLPEGVSLVTVSGVDDAGSGYVNLREAIRPGGLQPGSISDGVAITFSNPEQLRLALNPTVLVSGPNQSPIFSEIEPLTVMPGQTLEIDLEATDPDGDPVTYSLRSDEDLPKGKLNGSGKLTFEPTPDQIGTYEFTLVATDGVAETSQQISLTVEPDPDTTTRISGQILDVEGNPLANLPLSLGRLQAFTDADGYFTMVIPQTSFPTEEIDIDIPLGDPAFDPFFTGTSEIDLRRTAFDGATGTSLSNPLRHPNLVSTFMDASMVYGSNATRAAALRTNDGTGQLKTSEGGLLPINNSEFFPDGALTNNNRGLTDPAALFATGDVRANENIGLTAIHTVFVREHNRLVDEISAANSELSGEELYQRARKLVAAQIQHITYSEYLPLLVGDRTIADYSGYDAEVDPSVSHLFSAAAFRMGHTQSPDKFLLIDGNGQTLPPVSLNESTFNPELVQEHGVEAILRGLFAQPAEAIDTKVIDELRNTLFGPPGSGGIDLAAVDIQRGRDVGLPDYNQARVDFGLAPVTSFTEITSDEDLQALLEQVYGNVNDIDAIVGGLAEDTVPGSMVGEFFQTVIADQFARLRDGDRFWYENAQFTVEELSFIRGTSLSALLERNTEITGLAENLFSTGRNPAAPAEGGTVAAKSVDDYASIDGANNNLANPELGTAGTNLRVDYTQEYGDGIRSLAGEDRANVREISNTIFTQDESIPDQTGATAFMLAWSQFMGHDMTLAPAGAADTLKVYGTQYESAEGEAFPFVAEKLNLVLGHEVYAGVNNVIERPIYLPALAIDDNEQTVDANGDITVTNEKLGAQVFVEANTLTDNRGNPFTGQLSITEVPPELTPAALPDNLSPDLVVTIQPGEMVFSEPALLTLPNRAGWAPGTSMDLWSINPTTGEFEIVGKGQVSEDSSVVETIEGGIRNSSWHFLVPEPAEPKASPRNKDEGCEECSDNKGFTSTVDSHSGGVLETHNLVTYQSQGASRGVRLVYDSLRADPRPIVHTAFEPLETRGPTYLISTLTFKNGDFEYQVPGYSGDEYGLEGGEHLWRVPDGNQSFDVAMQADLNNLSSGAYTYEVESGFYLNVRDSFSGSSVTNESSLIHVNTANSVFGSGWSVAGTQEIVENPDGSVLIIDGDGSEVLFKGIANNPNGFQSPPGDFSTLVKLSDGTFERTTKDKTVFKFSDSNKLIAITDSQQNMTQHVYDTDHLIQIIDSVGLVTTFNYKNDRVSEIVDPAGRSTQLKYDAAGNLTEIIDPDSSKRQFGYDLQHHMTSEVDKEGYREEAFYDFAGRASHAVRKDGSVVRINPVQVQGLYRAELTSSFGDAPLINNLEFTAASEYADATGNVTKTFVDSAGQRILSRDREGFTSLSRRDDRNLVESITNARGFTTSYKYDERGNVVEIIYPFSRDNNNSDSTELTFGDWLQVTNTSFEYHNPTRVQDFNRDGKDDFALDSKIYFSNGTDIFSDISISFSQNEDITDEYIAGDINQDGALDIIDYDGIRYNSGDGRFLEKLFRETGQYTYYPVAVGDLDGDDDIDIVDYGSGNLYIGLNNGDDTFSQSLEENYSTSYAGGAVVSDFNNDGADDLVATRYNDLELFTSSGDGSFISSILLADSLNNNYDEDDLILTADMDGNGAVDIVLERQILFNDGTGSFTLSTDFLAHVSTDFQLAAIGDLDNDGDIDLIGTNASTEDQGSSFIVLSTPVAHLNDGTGTFDESVQLPIGEFGEVDAMALGDFDGDGRSDLLLSSGAVYISYNVVGTNPESTQNPSRQYIYDETFNQVTSMTDELGRQTLYEIDGLGDRISETRVVGELDSTLNGETDDVVMTYSYTADGQIDIQTDALGRETDYDYNNRGLLESITFAKGTDVEATQRFEYDDAGNQTAVINEKGDRTEYVYDTMNRQVQVIHADPDGTDGPLTSPTIFITYDERGNVVSQTDANGNRTTNAYDVAGRLTKTTDVLGNSIHHEYNEQGRLVARIDQLGRKTESVYDSRGRLEKTILSDSSVIETKYDTDNNRIGNIDANGNAFRTVYDERDRVVKTFDALGNENTTEYDAAGQVVARIDANGNRTEFEYDDLGRHVAVTDALGNVTRTEYDKTGKVTALSDALGRTTRFEYDDRGRRTATINALGNVTRTEYDAAGLRTAQIDANGNRTEYSYDQLNRLVAVTDALGNVTRTEYDAVGLRTAQIDGLGKTTQFEYDAMNRLVATIDPFGSVTATTYDALGNVLSITDALNNTTTYAYDDLNRLVEETNELGATRFYRYDNQSNRVSTIDRNGRERVFIYDDLNRQIEEQWLDNTGNVTRSSRSVYDAAGQMIEVSDPDSTYRYFYDALGQQVTIDNADTLGIPNVVLNYTYDNMGNILSVTDTIDGIDGGTNIYSYDELNRMTQLTQRDNGVSEKRVDFSYTPIGQFKSTSRYSDLTGNIPVVTTDYTYDADNRLERLSHRNNAEEVAFYDFTYDAASRITSIVDIDGTNNYSYNNRDELTGAVHSDVSNPDEIYEYDANGNRVASSLHNSDYVTGSNNQLIADGTYTYDYDAEGNMIRQTETATGNVRTFEWDYHNRLVSVVNSDINGTEVQRVAYTYDAMGRRIAKTVNTDGAGIAQEQMLKFVYDRDDVLLDFEEGESAPSQRYLHGPQVDQVIAQESETGETLWHLSDHLGTVKDLANNAGNVANHRTFDSYGNIIKQSDSTLGSRYAFTGREFDQETGLSYYRARYYNSQNGRFISQDPIGFDAGDSNLYRYVNNHPVKYTDPSGKRVSVGYRPFPDSTGIPALDEFIDSIAPFSHTTIILEPEEPCDFENHELFYQRGAYKAGELATLSGWPRNGLLRGYAFGVLAFVPNAAADSPAYLDGDVQVDPPIGMNDTDFILELIKAAETYATQVPVPYFGVPSWFKGTYNSNSFVSGVITAAGAVPPSLYFASLLSENGAPSIPMGDTVFQPESISAPGYTRPLPIYLPVPNLDPEFLDYDEQRMPRTGSTPFQDGIEEF